MTRLFFVLLSTFVLESAARAGGCGADEADCKPADRLQVLTIRQTWEQEPDGYDRPLHISLPARKLAKMPVVIFFHGNGGDAKRALREWAELFPDRLVASAQGYQKSWNIHGERSKAPDVDFFRKIVAKIAATFPGADMGDVTLIGSSNGGGMIHRLMIEVDEDLFCNAVPLVASMIEQQYHDGSFWLPSKHTDDYDTKKAPTGGRRILYAHGTRDRVVPFGGGFRGKFGHISAHETAYRWAQAQGYKGARPGEGAGTGAGKGVIRYDYKGTGVTFLVLDGGSHGMQPMRNQVKKLIREFVSAKPGKD